jgi:Tfp pilus assembly protein PilO
MNSFKLNIKPLYLWRLPFLFLGLFLAMLVLSYAIYKSYTYENRDKLIKLKKEELTLKTDLERKYNLYANLAQYKAKESNLLSLEQQIKQILPISDELPNIIIRINQVAQDSNIVINSFTPKNPAKEATNAGGLAAVPPPAKANSSASVAIATTTKNANANPSDSESDKTSYKLYGLSATGSFADFLIFIYNIAKIPRVMEITNLQLARVTNDKISISCDIKIFYSN